jgi:hypothetical protein
LEKSVARYLAQLDTADRQEPSEELAAKTAHLREKLVKLESEMQRLAAMERLMLASPDQQISSPILTAARWRRAEPRLVPGFAAKRFERPRPGADLGRSVQFFLVWMLARTMASCGLSRYNPDPSTRDEIDALEEPRSCDHETAPPENPPRG